MESTEKLAKKLTETQEFSTNVDKFLDKNLYIEGKTMREWKRHFHINIPDDITFPVVISLAAKISQHHQEAAFYREKQQVQLAIMEQSKADEYHSAYQSAQDRSRAKYNKNLAADSCKVEAILAVKGIDNAISNQKVIHNFWAKTCNTLTEMRKILELCARALSSDAYIQRDMVIRGDGK